jgi:FkbM family methyltransferase
VSQPLEIADGGIRRTDEQPLADRVRFARRLLDWEPVRHAGSARKLGALVRESRKFAAAELAAAAGVRRYHLRNGGRPVLLRHGTEDIWTFAEIFSLRMYEPPPAVDERLRAADAPNVIDLGANIGLFGVDLLTRYPNATVMSFEPDAENAAIHRRLIEINDAAGRWVLLEAAAGTHDGVVGFLAGRENESRVAEPGSPETVDVLMNDVMPLLAGAELVKMDIEGGEWPILADERFGAVRAVVLEYHPHGCPTDDPQKAATDLLEGHGLTVTPLFHEPRTGVGMAWAVRGRTSTAPGGEGEGA